VTLIKERSPAPPKADSLGSSMESNRDAEAYRQSQLRADERVIGLQRE
jgi:hypothetical protein